MTPNLSEFTSRLLKVGFSQEQATVLLELQEEILSHLQNCGLRQTPIDSPSSRLFAGNERSVLVEKRQIADLSERLGDLTRELKDQAFSRKLDQICIITVLMVALIGFIASR